MSNLLIVADNHEDAEEFERRMVRRAYERIYHPHQLERDLGDADAIVIVGWVSDALEDAAAVAAYEREIPLLRDEVASSIRSGRYGKGKPDTSPISPGHYQGFSNGAEVIDITENLTSNGGQAVQCIARSTRLDGANKGNPVEDLEKAAWFIQREITRLNPA